MDGVFNQLKLCKKFNRKKMKLTFLGTNSGCPTKERNVSSMALQYENGEVFLFGKIDYVYNRLW